MADDQDDVNRAIKLMRNPIRKSLKGKKQLKLNKDGIHTSESTYRHATATEEVRSDPDISFDEILKQLPMIKKIPSVENTKNAKHFNPPIVHKKRSHSDQERRVHPHPFFKYAPWSSDHLAGGNQTVGLDQASEGTSKPVANTLNSAPNKLSFHESNKKYLAAVLKKHKSDSLLKVSRTLPRAFDDDRPKNDIPHKSKTIHASKKDTKLHLYEIPFKIYESLPKNIMPKKTTSKLSKELDQFVKFNNPTSHQDCFNVTPPPNSMSRSQSKESNMCDHAFTANDEGRKTATQSTQRADSLFKSVMPTNKPEPGSQSTDLNTWEVVYATKATEKNTITKSAQVDKAGYYSDADSLPKNDMPPRKPPGDHLKEMDKCKVAYPTKDSKRPTTSATTEVEKVSDSVMYDSNSSKLPRNDMPPRKSSSGNLSKKLETFAEASTKVEQALYRALIYGDSKLPRNDMPPKKSSSGNQSKKLETCATVSTKTEQPIDIVYYNDYKLPKKDMPPKTSSSGNMSKKLNMGGDGLTTNVVERKISMELTKQHKDLETTDDSRVTIGQPRKTTSESTMTTIKLGDETPHYIVEPDTLPKNCMPKPEEMNLNATEPLTKGQDFTSSTTKKTNSNSLLIGIDNTTRQAQIIYPTRCNDLDSSTKNIMPKELPPISTISETCGPIVEKQIEVEYPKNKMPKLTGSKVNSTPEKPFMTTSHCELPKNSIPKKIDNKPVEIGHKKNAGKLQKKSEVESNGQQKKQETIDRNQRFVKSQQLFSKKNYDNLRKNNKPLKSNVTGPTKRATTDLNVKVRLSANAPELVHTHAKREIKQSKSKSFFNMEHAAAALHSHRQEPTQEPSPAIKDAETAEEKPNESQPSPKSINNSMHLEEKFRNQLPQTVKASLIMESIKEALELRKEADVMKHIQGLSRETKEASTRLTDSLCEGQKQKLGKSSVSNSKLLKTNLKPKHGSQPSLQKRQPTIVRSHSGIFKGSGNSGKDSASKSKAGKRGMPINVKRESAANKQIRRPITVPRTSNSPCKPSRHETNKTMAKPSTPNTLVELEEKLSLHENKPESSQRQEKGLRQLNATVSSSGSNELKEDIRQESLTNQIDSENTKEKSEVEAKLLKPCALLQQKELTKNNNNEMSLKHLVELLQNMMQTPTTNNEMTTQSVHQNVEVAKEAPTLKSSSELVEEQELTKPNDNEMNFKHMFELLKSQEHTQINHATTKLSVDQNTEVTKEENVLTSIAEQAEQTQANGNELFNYYIELGKFKPHELIPINNEMAKQSVSQHKKGTYTQTNGPQCIIDVPKQQDSKKEARGNLASRENFKKDTTEKSAKQSITRKTSTGNQKVVKASTNRQNPMGDAFVEKRPNNNKNKTESRVSRPAQVNLKSISKDEARSRAQAQSIVDEYDRYVRDNKSLKLRKNQSDQTLQTKGQRKTSQATIPLRAQVIPNSRQNLKINEGNKTASSEVTVPQTSKERPRPHSVTPYPKRDNFKTQERLSEQRAELKVSTRAKRQNSAAHGIVKPPQKSNSCEVTSVDRSQLKGFKPRRQAEVLKPTKSDKFVQPADSTKPPGVGRFQTPTPTQHVSMHNWSNSDKIDDSTGEEKVPNSLATMPNAQPKSDESQAEPNLGFKETSTIDTSTVGSENHTTTKVNEEQASNQVLYPTNHPQLPCDLHAPIVLKPNKATLAESEANILTEERSTIENTAKVAETNLPKSVTVDKVTPPPPSGGEHGEETPAVAETRNPFLLEPDDEFELKFVENNDHPRIKPLSEEMWFDERNLSDMVERTVNVTAGQTHPRLMRSTLAHLSYTPVLPALAAINALADSHMKPVQSGVARDAQVAKLEYKKEDKILVLRDNAKTATDIPSGVTNILSKMGDTISVAPDKTAATTSHIPAVVDIIPPTVDGNMPAVISKTSISSNNSEITEKTSVSPNNIAETCENTVPSKNTTAVGKASISLNNTAVAGETSVLPNNTAVTGKISVPPNNIAVAGETSKLPNNTAVAGKNSEPPNSTAVAGGTSALSNNTAVAGKTSILPNNTAVTGGASVPSNNTAGASETSTLPNNSAVTGKTSVPPNNTAVAGGTSLLSNNTAVAGETSVLPNNIAVTGERLAAAADILPAVKKVSTETDTNSAQKSETMKKKPAMKPVRLEDDDEFELKYDVTDQHPIIKPVADVVWMKDVEVGEISEQSINILEGQTHPRLIALNIPPHPSMKPLRDSAWMKKNDLGDIVVKTVDVSAKKLKTAQQLPAESRPIGTTEKSENPNVSPTQPRALQQVTTTVVPTPKSPGWQPEVLRAAVVAAAQGLPQKNKLNSTGEESNNNIEDLILAKLNPNFDASSSKPSIGILTPEPLEQPKVKVPTQLVTTSNVNQHVKKPSQTEIIKTPFIETMTQKTENQNRDTFTSQIKRKELQKIIQEEFNRISLKEGQPSLQSGIEIYPPQPVIPELPDVDSLIREPWPQRHPNDRRLGGEPSPMDIAEGTTKPETIINLVRKEVDGLQKVGETDKPPIVWQPQHNTTQTKCPEITQQMIEKIPVQGKELLAISDGSTETTKPTAQTTTRLEDNKMCKISKKAGETTKLAQIVHEPPKKGRNKIVTQTQGSHEQSPEKPLQKEIKTYVKDLNRIGYFQQDTTKKSDKQSTQSTLVLRPTTKQPSYKQSDATKSRYHQINYPQRLRTHSSHNTERVKTSMKSEGRPSTATGDTAPIYSAKAAGGAPPPSAGGGSGSNKPPSSDTGTTSAEQEWARNSGEPPLTGLSKHFNSSTIRGRANVAKATIALLGMYAIIRMFRKKPQDY